MTVSNYTPASVTNDPLNSTQRKWVALRKQFTRNSFSILLSYLLNLIDRQFSIAIIFESVTPIGLWCSKFKMMRVYAYRVVASMQYVKTSSWIALVDLIRKTRSEIYFEVSSTSADTELSTSANHSSDPRPAFINTSFVDVTPETVYIVRGQIGHRFYSHLRDFINSDACTLHFRKFCSFGSTDSSNVSLPYLIGIVGLKGEA